MGELPQPMRIRTSEFDRMVDAFDSDRPRVQLVGGYLFEMPPIGTAHLVLVTRLQQLFGGYNAQLRLLVQQPLIVADYDEPQPDLVILQRPLSPRKPSQDEAALVIEVSDTTWDLDRFVKAPAYMKAGVPLLWLVDVRNQAIDLFEPDAPTLRCDQDDLVSFERVSFRVGELFAGLPLTGSP